MKLILPSGHQFEGSVEDLKMLKKTNPEMFVDTSQCDINPSSFLQTDRKTEKTMTESIVLLNKIKYVLSENCLGTAPWQGLDKPCGLPLELIYRKLPQYSEESIEALLKLETQTFYFDAKTTYWIMFPDIVDSIKQAVAERNLRMSKLYNEKQLSRFISHDSYKEILLLRQCDFDEILRRCEKLSECDSSKVHLPASELWNVVLYASDEEFSVRLKWMKSATIKNSTDLALLLSCKAVSFQLDNLGNRLAKLEKKSIQPKEQQYKIQFADFVIKSYIFKCNANHNIEQIQAQIDIMSPNGTIVTELISAGYCRICKCYFILESDFNSLRSKGAVLCQQMTYDVYRQKGYDILNAEELKPESLLHQCGYNVSSTENLTSIQRKEILCRVVDNGLYSISGICSHLDWLISRNKKITNRDMSAAISKWQEDRAFISNYNSTTQRKVGGSSISKTNYK